MYRSLRKGLSDSLVKPVLVACYFSITEIYTKKFFRTTYMKTIGILREEMDESLKEIQEHTNNGEKRQN